jgi:hypothetical protein
LPFSARVSLLCHYSATSPPHATSCRDSSARTAWSYRSLNAPGSSFTVARSTPEQCGLAVYGRRRYLSNAMLPKFLHKQLGDGCQRHRPHKAIEVSVHFNVPLPGAFVRLGISDISLPQSRQRRMHGFLYTPRSTSETRKAKNFSASRLLRAPVDSCTRFPFAK